jgi:hypothetical protein
MGSSSAAAQVSHSLVVLEGVRCFGSTVEKNPGCPGCGYVGWIPISPGSPLRHSGIGVASVRRSALRLST